MNKLRDSHHADDPPSALPKDMKTICAWCEKVIQEGPSEKLSHGICKDCEKGMTEEFNRAKREQDHFEPCHDGECQDPLDFVGRLIFISFAVLLIWFLAVMAAEGLHWLTGGKVPRLIDWGPEIQHSHHRPESPPRADSYADPD